MIKWKPVNPDRRLPGYLQAHTKENLVWQLKLTAVFLVVMIAVDKIQEKRRLKRLLANMKTTPNPS